MPKCTIENCDRKYGTEEGRQHGGGHQMCAVHYARWSRGMRNAALRAPIREKWQGITLTPEEQELVWQLLYNVCSAGEDAFKGLDVPNDVPGTLHRYDRLRLRMEERMFD